MQASVTYIDMSNNWWGTTDADSIMAWIEDGNDHDDWPYIVNYEPFQQGSVPTTKESMNGFKALFR